MNELSPRSVLIQKMQRRIAALVVVVTGPLIAILVIIQLYNGVISVKGSDVTAQADPFGFYLLNGILGCSGIIALMVSIATARHLFQKYLKR
ncbi:hypothetical protein N5C66_21220 [Rhizobium pusense]|uniref:hypothetical protein n=1 Tax=Agrobacterium pusense TaxID=648995 RepID=UPI000D1A7BAD|nr:hypothetical protein [Agrobacterium pusense]MDH0911771.1 hypothetical protein [Agrobacterium pusense]MDH1097842.1 hypothetical protein [Agrobacterium pusense]MDH1114263.1 hypothetical protein [Agrobacterium pusense]MDH2196359.1 hypothetical protein [Agrobacterium pusense]